MCCASCDWRGSGIAGLRPGEWARGGGERLGARIRELGTLGERLEARVRELSTLGVCDLALKHDEVLEREQIAIGIKPPEKDDLIAELQALHEDVLTYRNGEPLDVDRDHEAMWEE